MLCQHQKNYEKKNFFFMFSREKYKHRELSRFELSKNNLSIKFSYVFASGKYEWKYESREKQLKCRN